jgi:hypothetical protein
MRREHLLVLILVSFCQISAPETSKAQESKAVHAAQSNSKLKWVELDSKYKIQVPDDFTLGRMSDQISSFPDYYFNATPPNYTSVQIFLLPKFGKYQIDPKTGRPQLPIQLDGATLTNSFDISGGIFVYYGWGVDDEAYECSMNSPCPAPVPPDMRYRTTYVFEGFDEAHDTIIEFRADHLGPTQNVTKLEGDGKLLRDIIIPSLSSTR